VSKFLLLLGPSGVGKSTIIEELCRIDKRFVYISPYTTRPLREGEKNKISISGEQMDEMWSRRELLVINKLYGIRYATPRLPIEEALASEGFPVLDWPVSRIEVMNQAFPNQLYVKLEESLYLLNFGSFYFLTKYFLILFLI
jgi:guanylate kinase